MARADNLRAHSVQDAEGAYTNLYGPKNGPTIATVVGNGESAFSDCGDGRVNASLPAKGGNYACDFLVAMLKGQIIVVARHPLAGFIVILQ